MTHIVGSLRERFHEPQLDPPEPWERPVESEIGTRRGRGLGGHPYAPLRWEDVPQGAAEALEAACGAWRLDQLFVIPASGRRLVGRRDRWVAAPTQVLGLADEGVALWVDTEPEPRVIAAIALDELAAIDQVQILLYARLTLLAPGRTLTVRYNAVARHDLDGELTAVRAAACGYPLPVPGGEPEPAMPHKWAHLLHSSAVCLQPGDPVVARVGELPAGRGETRTALIALTPGELIVARDPDPDVLGGSSPYGHDVLSVPRRQLESAERIEMGVRLRAGGVDVDVRLSPPLADELAALAERGRAP
jgi:hypothetical protein